MYQQIITDALTRESTFPDEIGQNIRCRCLVSADGGGTDELL
jgi:hypothetical protein